VTAGAVVAAAVLAAAAVAGVLWRRRDGRLSRAAAGTVSLSAAQLGQPLGARATLLQFSSDFCAPCRAARQLLADVAGRQPGLAHIEIDVGGRMDLVRQLDIRRTPTVLVLDSRGRLVQRGSGVPRREDILAALAAAPLPAGSREHAGTAAGEQAKPTEARGSDSAHGPA
jgi:thiol-disulfide isomerase/thioredoxin